MTVVFWGGSVQRVSEKLLSKLHSPSFIPDHHMQPSLQDSPQGGFITYVRLQKPIASGNVFTNCSLVGFNG